MKRIFRLFALLLAVCLLASSLTSCGAFMRTLFTLAQEQNQSTTEEEKEQNDAPLDWKKVTLSDEDIQEYYDIVDEFTQMMLNNENEFSLVVKLDLLIEKLYFINTQASIAHVLYAQDITSEKAEADYRRATVASDEVYEAYMQMCRTIYQSDCALRDDFFSKWDEASIALMLSYGEEFTEQKEKIGDLTLEYMECLQSDSFSMKSVLPLLFELIPMNRTLAELFGYETYEEYAYEIVYNREYGKTELESFRTYVKEVIYPLYQIYEQRYIEGVQALTYSEWQQARDFLVEDYAFTEEENLLIDYAKATGTKLADATDRFFHSGTVIFSENENAMPSAFTTYLRSLQTPVAFFAPGLQTRFNIAHELGHYYAMSYNVDATKMMDLSEVHSQANELLLLVYLRDQVGENVYKVLTAGSIYNMLYQILLCTMTDELEQLFYSRDVKTEAEVLECIEFVKTSYGLVEGDLLNEQIENYWMSVAFDRPLYHISYAVSAVISLEIYAVGLQDFKEGCTLYATLAEEANPDDGFLGILEKIGLSSPFEEETYKKIEETLK